jgi:release factor glutamine methyltransferase
MEKTETWTIIKVLEWTTGYFAKNGVDAPRLAAEILLAHSLQKRRLDLYLQHDKPLLPGELAAYRALIKRRAAREPLAYITGFREFWSMDLAVNPAVLIPRPETECLVEAALELLPSAESSGPRRVLDLGTGSGALILAIARERPGHQYTASDTSRDALAAARANAQTHGFSLDFAEGPWFAPFPPFPAGPGFHLVVSNPPYIRSADIPTLMPEVRDYEPRQALDGGPDGLAAYREILSAAWGHVLPGGHVALEVGPGQEEDVSAIAEAAGKYAPPAFRQDLAGITRVVVFALLP